MLPRAEALSPVSRKSLAPGRAASTAVLAARRKSVCSPDMLRALHRGQRRPQTAPEASGRARKQRPATASGAPLALLLGDEQFLRRTRGDPLLQHIEDAEVKRQKGLLRCQSFAYRDWVVDKSAKAPEDLQELREKHNHVHRVRRPQSSPAPQGRRRSLGELRLKPQGWEALSPSQQLRSLSTVLETTGRRNHAHVSGPDGFSRLLEAVARETGGKSREKQDKEEREKAEADRVMIRLVELLLASSSTLKAGFDKIDTMGRGKLCKKDFDAGLRAMGFDDFGKDKKTIFRLLGFEASEGPASPGRSVQLSFRDLEAKLSPFLAVVITSHQEAYRAQHGGVLPHLDPSMDSEQLVLQQFKHMLTSDEPGGWPGFASRRARCRGSELDAPERRKLFQGSTMTEAQREAQREAMEDCERMGPSTDPTGLAT